MINSNRAPTGACGIAGYRAGVARNRGAASWRLNTNAPERDRSLFDSGLVWLHWHGRGRSRCHASGIGDAGGNGDFVYAPPVTNAAGEITGDPFAQCVTTGTTQPEIPNCEGDPNFEWKPTATFTSHEGIHWLTEAVFLSDRGKPWLTLGFELGKDCGITRIRADETDQSVTVALKYVSFTGTAERCTTGGEKYALQLGLLAPLKDRELIIDPFGQ